MYYIGIDPGKKGGIAVIEEKIIEDECGNLIGPKLKLRTQDLSSFGDDQRRIFLGLKNIVNHYTPNCVLLERISPTIFGIDKGSGAKIYGNYRELGMALVAIDCKHTEVDPQTWQRGLGIPPRVKKSKRKGIKRGESTSEWKARLKRSAQEIFPRFRVTLSVSDAILIAEYGRRVYREKEGRP